MYRFHPFRPENHRHAIRHGKAIRSPGGAAQTLSNRFLLPVVEEKPALLTRTPMGKAERRWVLLPTVSPCPPNGKRPLFLPAVNSRHLYAVYCSYCRSSISEAQLLIGVRDLDEKGSLPMDLRRMLSPRLPPLTMSTTVFQRLPDGRMGQKTVVHDRGDSLAGHLSISPGRLPVISSAKPAASLTCFNEGQDHVESLTACCE